MGDDTPVKKTPVMKAVVAKKKTDAGEEGGGAGVA